MSRDLQSDRNLAERAKQGDGAAWRTIYDATCDGLFALLCYQIGDRDEARDVLQDTYLQAFRRLGTWRGEAPLAVWLRAIALGRALDWKRVILRRLKRTVRLDATVADRLGVPPQVDGVRFESERDALRRALARLSPQQRAALLLREWDGLAFHDIAGLLGCAESTARVHHARARERMRAALGRDVAREAGHEWEGQRT
jgi:RNA polymerase sigma-70 factor (ECF subfamily)